jgi:hypothetical protein
MTKSDLLDKIKVLLRKMQDHDTPDDVSNKEELGPLLKDAEELLETVSILKYLIEEEEVENEVAASTEDPKPEVTETAPPVQKLDSENLQPIVEEKTEAESQTSEHDTVETVGVDATVQPENTGAELGEGSTINETIAPPAKDASIAHQLEREVVNDLQSAIGVNERFLYINELFAGDGDAYRDAVQQLDSFANLPEALKYVRAELSDRYTWDQEQESTISFYSLIEKRYAD